MVLHFTKCKMRKGPIQNQISGVACRPNSIRRGLHADVNSHRFQNARLLRTIDLSDNRPDSYALASLKWVDKSKRFAAKCS